MTLNCTKDEFVGDYSLDKIVSPWIGIVEYTKQKFLGNTFTRGIPFEIKKMQDTQA